MLKIVMRPGTVPGVGDLYVRASWDGHRLSMVGVAGPKHNGNARGSSGQCQDELGEVTIWSEGWDAAKGARLRAIWERWHLNDMRTGSQVQEDWLRDNPVKAVYPESYYEKACEALAAAGLHPDPEGYKYGSRWKTEEVPEEIIKELFSFPPSDRPCPWTSL